MSRGHADFVRWGPLVKGDILDTTALIAEELGTEYDCGTKVDRVWVRLYRVEYGVAGRTITIHSVASKDHIGRLPIVRFDVDTDTLALNGKRCREKK